MGNLIKKKRIIIWSKILIIIFLIVTILPYNNYLLSDNINKGFNRSIKPSGPFTPEGIRLTVVNDSSNSMVITWYTTDSASDPKVIYSNDSVLTYNFTVIPSTKSVVSTYIYTASLQDLESNRTYYYKISSDASNEREILNFTTSPLENATSLKFLVFGDSRSQPEQRTEIVNKIMDNFEDIDFSIHTGDIISDGKNQSQWDDYFKDIELLTKQIPGFFIEGNHERNDGYMYDNIPLPFNGLNSHYYNFSIGPVNFIGLNTQRDSSIQTTWLEEALNRSHQDNNTLWKIVYMHQPIFNSMSSRPDRSDLITNWCPLLEEYEVDLVFAGHNHYYERSYPMNQLKQYDNSTNFNFKNPLNPMYFITGGAGAPPHTRDTTPGYAPFYNSTYHFLIVEIVVDNIKEETILTLETWGMLDISSEIYLIDNLTIVKRGAFLNILSPTTNQLFGRIAPSFNISVEKVKLKPSWYIINTTWYNIEGVEQNFINFGDTGLINQDAWDIKTNGSFRINFYVNDSRGNIESNSILVRKDDIPPNVSIIDPGPNQLFGKTPFNFSIIIDEQNLDSTWYSINQLNTNFSFSGTGGVINDAAWFSLEDGNITITFYANDSLGNLGSSGILIQKDSLAPSIIIIFPITNASYGINALNFTINVNDDHLDLMWYSFNGSVKKFFFIENSTIDQEEWEMLDNGKIIIIFYANDSVGNVAFKEVLILKDVPEVNDDGSGSDLTVLIGLIIFFIVILTVGLISFIYVVMKRLD